MNSASPPIELSAQAAATKKNNLLAERFLNGIYESGYSHDEEALLKEVIQYLLGDCSSQQLAQTIH
ncbi:MAG: hypothetical protein PSV35_00675, partial [bacterium]|nr:hypothetical protein [bacterium]